MLFLLFYTLHFYSTVRAYSLTNATSRTAFLVFQKNSRGSVNPQSIGPDENSGRTFFFAKPTALAEFGEQVKYCLIGFFGHYIETAQTFSPPFSLF